MKVICRKPVNGLIVGDYYDVGLGKIGTYDKYIIYNKIGQGTFYEMDVFQPIDEIREEKIEKILKNVI
jgi:hypothetical protein